MALRPLSDAGLIGENSNLVCDCKSGASGAGKELRKDLHFVELDDNFKAYNLFSHRHTPEILEHTGLRESQLMFSTHLLPMSRGILSTIYVNLETPQNPDAIESLYRKFYAGRIDGAHLDSGNATGSDSIERTPISATSALCWIKAASDW